MLPQGQLLHLLNGAMVSPPSPPWWLNMNQKAYIIRHNYFSFLVPSRTLPLQP